MLKAVKLFIHKLRFQHTLEVYKTNSAGNITIEKCTYEGCNYSVIRNTRRRY